MNDPKLIWEGAMIAIRQMQLCIAAGVLQFERMNAVNNCEQTPFYWNIGLLFSYLEDTIFNEFQFGFFLDIMGDSIKNREGRAKKHLVCNIL